MSLHFQIDIAFDLRDNVSNDLIGGLKALSENRSLTEEQKKLIPNIFRYMSASETTNAFYGRSILYFENHYRHTKSGKDVSKWTFHLRQIFNDDLFYEEGYPLIAWLATVSDTVGFVGYLKEELEHNPRQIIFQDNIVTIRDGLKDDISFRLEDFNSEVTVWRD